MSYLQRPPTTSLMHTAYDDSSEDEDGGPPPFLPFSTNAVQIMDPRYKRSLELDQYSPSTAKRRKFHNTTGSAALGRYATTRVISYFKYNILHFRVTTDSLIFCLTVLLYSSIFSLNYLIVFKLTLISSS